MVLGKGKLTRKRIENWLEESLVPVEPSPAFVRQLRARLVNVRGDQVLSPWMLLLVLASVMILLATWLGLGLRIVLGLLALIGVTQRKRGRETLAKLPGESALAES